MSSDIVKNPASSIFDSQLTAVVDGTLVKVVSLVRQRVGLLATASSISSRSSKRPLTAEAGRGE